MTRLRRSSLNVPSASSPFTDGVNTVLVPRSLFLESKLWADFNSSSYAPLSSATLYAENLSQAEMSEAVATVTAGNMSGYDAYSLLQYLLHNATGSLASQAVDVTGYVPLLNLPTDALQIVPWEGVVNGPTGALPATFWQKVGAAATALVNGMVALGQLIYGGLVALAGFLVALGEAIAAWGMALVGTVQGALQAVQAALEKVGGVLTALFDWVKSLFLGILDPVLSFLEAWANDLASAGGTLLQAALSYDGSFGSTRALGQAIASFLGALFLPQLFLVIGIVSLAITAAYLAVMVTGVGAVVAGLIVSTIVEQLVAVLLQAVAPALEAALSWLADLVDSSPWLGTGVALALLGIGVAVFARFGATVQHVKVSWILGASDWDFVKVDYLKKVENVKSSRPLYLALVSLAIGVVAAFVNIYLDAPALVSVFVDLLALGFALWSMSEALVDPGKVLYGRLTIAISGAAIGYSTASIAGHLYSGSQGG